MRGAATVILISLLCPLGAVHAAPPLRFVNDPVVRIDFQADSSVDRAELFASTDGGRTWRARPDAERTAGALLLRVPDDGRYDFYLVLGNAAGQTPPPSALSEAHLRIAVDTRAPTIQLHSAALSALDAARRALRVRVTLVEENLAPDGVRLFIESSAGEPLDVGPVTVTERELLADWPADAPTEPELGLRAVVTDLAGNRSTATLARIEQPRADAQPARPALPALDESLDALSEDFGPSLPDASATRRASALRAQAASFRGQGRFPLAAARGSEALQLVPDDADLLTEVGRDLLSAQQPEEAAGRFEAALRTTPDHPEALLGLALADVTRRRFEPARDNLQRLVQLTPDDARALLHYGDIEHKLGHLPEAVTAWRRVLALPGVDPATRRKAEKRIELLAPRSPGA